MRRHEDHFRGRIELHDPVQDFHPGQVRHDQIREHDLRMMIVNQIDARLGIGRGENIQTGLRQGGGKQLQALFVVVDNQQRKRSIAAPA